MNAERWERIEEVCWTALDVPEERRAAFLAEECGDDEELLAAVRALLGEMERDPAFLEEPLVELHHATPPDGSDGSRRIGPFRVVRELGRGGMGEVYLGVREGDDFRVPVAIKIIRRGMDSDDVLERFRLERRILAGLRHPNIAQLLDGGVTDDGRPYFVMEYVDGERLRDYCDRQGHTIGRRLRLFQSICAAVQHAHQRLIVHRDLKPSNILVTTEGVPKLLDFGIAKVLTPEGEAEALVKTRTGVRVLTPVYAAPEQLRGEEPTTSTDIYGLGILLFELLTGARPYGDETTGAMELERRILQEPPLRPSTIPGRAALSGDLDNIVLKALAKEPERRYSSAAAFAEDIERHLDGRPVRARAPTLRYRAERFIHRNAAAVSLSAVVFASLVAFAAQAQLQSRRLTEERDKAREVSGFLLETFGATGADQAAGDTVTARELLDRQSEALRTTYADRPVLQAEMMHVIAEGYERLNLLDEAEQWAREALALRRESLGSRHADVAATLNVLGWVRQSAGDRDEARGLLEESISIYRDAGRSEQGRMSRALNDLGIVYEAFSDLEGARALFEEALEYRRATLGPSHRSVGITANNLAANHYLRGDYDAAIEAGEEAVAALQASLGPDHQRSIVAQSNLAIFAGRGGDLAAAERVYRDLVERHTRLAGPNGPARITVLRNLATVLRGQGEHAEALEVLREVQRVQEATLDANHPNRAVTLVSIGLTLSESGDAVRAIPRFEDALEIFDIAYGGAHRDMIDPLWGLGRAHQRLGAMAEAETALRESLDMAERTLGTEHPRTSTILGWLSDVRFELGAHDEALALSERAYRIVLGALPADHPQLHHARLALAEAFVRVGDSAAVDSLIALSRPGLEAGEGDDAARQRLEDLLARR